jgi:VWFA-related protein
MGSPRVVGVAFGVLLALAGVPGAAHAREQTPAPATPQAMPSRTPDVVVPASVEVVRIDVVVSEKRGRPRVGLRREDFVVLEDGKPQPIVQFQAFARPEAAPNAASPPAGAAASVGRPAQPEEDEAEELLPARYVALVIDDVHIPFENLASVRKALNRFLDEDLRPEDQVALVTTSGAYALSQEFTSDREALHDVLDRLSAHGRRPERSDPPYMSEYQAELIERGDAMALEAAVQELLLAGLFQDAYSAELVARHKAREVMAEAVYDSRLTLEALEGLCRGLSALTGRKVLFLVSDGFLTGLSAGSGTQFDIRRITDAATQAGVVIYSLDTSGLHVRIPVASASSLRRPGAYTFSTIEAMRQRSEEATRHAINSLASDTGGFLADNTNNLRAGLRELLKDTETYYVLAYEPTNTRRDGGFRKIEVRVPGVPGLKVRTRAGYFAPDDRRLVTAGHTAEDEARRAEQRRTEMNTALRSLAPLAGIPVQLSADFLSLDGAAAELVVSGSVDVSTLAFVRLDGRRLATIDVTGVVYDESGQVAAKLETQRSKLDLDEVQYESLLQSGVPYRRVAILPAGRYQVRLAAREDATGLLGSAWKKIEVPDLVPGRLVVSSLFLMKDEPARGGAAVPGPSDASAPGGAMAPDNAPSLRSVQGRRQFARGESLYVQLYAYNARRDASGALALAAQAEVLRGGVSLGTAVPEPMEAPSHVGPVGHLSRIPLRSFQPGEYELRVTVMDRNAHAMATRGVAFTVE